MKKSGPVIFTISMFIISFFVIVLIGLASIPYNPISLNFENKNAIFILAPQGWGFFTRNPREPQTFVYAKKNGIWQLVDKPSSDPSFLFGVSRVNRKIIFEKDVILSKIKNNSWWSDNNGRSLNQMASLLHPVTFHNPIPGHILTGAVLIIKKDPIPWAWSTSYYKIHMPFKCVLVKILN